MSTDTSPIFTILVHALLLALCLVGWGAVFTSL